jgi:hypothetical protein
MSLQQAFPYSSQANQHGPNMGSWDREALFPSKQQPKNCLNQ